LPIISPSERELEAHEIVMEHIRASSDNDVGAIWDKVTADKPH